MELVVLGADGSWPGPSGATSGYLVRHEGFSMWMDAGFGTIGRLQEYVGLTELGAVLISHGHRDHFADLYALFASRRFGRTPAQQLPVYALAGVKESMGQLVSERSGDAWATTFDWHEIAAGDAAQVGPFSVRCFGMPHFGPSLGFRIVAAGSALAYTGDTGPSEEVVGLARGADVLLAESTWQDGEKTHDKHLTARECGAYAARARVGRLILTHIEPGHDPALSMAQAAEEFNGEISLAVHGSRLEVGR